MEADLLSSIVFSAPKEQKERFANHLLALRSFFAPID